MNFSDPETQKVLAAGFAGFLGSFALVLSGRFDILGGIAAVVVTTGALILLAVVSSHKPGEIKNVLLGVFAVFLASIPIVAAIGTLLVGDPAALRDFGALRLIAVIVTTFAAIAVAVFVARSQEPRKSDQPRLKTPTR